MDDDCLGPCLFLLDSLARSSASQSSVATVPHQSVRSLSGSMACTHMQSVPTSTRAARPSIIEDFMSDGGSPVLCDESGHTNFLFRTSPTCRCSLRLRHGSGPAQDLLRLAHPKNHFRR